MSKLDDDNKMVKATAAAVQIFGTIGLLPAFCVLEGE